MGHGNGKVAGQCISVSMRFGATRWFSFRIGYLIPGASSSGAGLGCTWSRRSSGSTKLAVAKRLLKLREGMVAQGTRLTTKTNTATMDELFQDVVSDYKINRRRSVEDVERRLRLHLTAFFYHKKAATICTADVRHFTLMQQEAGYANAEINRQLAIVRRAFSLGVQNGKLIQKVYVPMLKESSPRSGFFERHQFESVCAHLPEPLRPVVTFAYITGWRKSEILGLQWRNIDFQAGRVTLDAGTTKNDAARTFPFTQELQALLEGQKTDTDALQRKLGTVIPWIFHRDGKRIRVFRKAWHTACQGAGVPGRIPHDFRRTAVRNLVRAGIPERVAMTMTGHKTRAVFERYNIVSEGDLEMAARKLDEAALKTEQHSTAPLAMDKGIS